MILMAKTNDNKKKLMQINYIVRLMRTMMMKKGNYRENFL